MSRAAAAPRPSFLAISVTLVFAVSSKLQPEPPADVQLMPVPVTVSLPVTETLSGAVNVAVTFSGPVIKTVQVVLVPLQAPPQPVKVAPVDGVAVSVRPEFVVSLSYNLSRRWRYS